MPSQKHFTLEQANATIEIIRPLLIEIQEIRAGILKNRPELWQAMERAAGNGGSTELTHLASEFERLDILVHRILDTGVEIKDLSSGLLDFPALRHDREVYLCWKMDEDQVLYWHDVEFGICGAAADRNLLTALSTSQLHVIARGQHECRSGKAEWVVHGPQP